MYLEDEYLMLSGIQHFEFCRRQWALIHIEQQWAENEKTTSGKIMHKNAHGEKHIEKKNNMLIMRSLPVASSSLGVSGQCDVVEFHKAANGIDLQHHKGPWEVIPVEYKRGTAKKGLEDKVQLCAQAICLEEMLLCKIPFGYLYYGENKRRKYVEFDDILRKHVIALTEEMHSLYKKRYTPKVKRSAKCGGCSLKSICMPKLVRTKRVDSYINDKVNGGEI